jgi:hypothetical protein
MILAFNTAARPPFGLPAVSAILVIIACVQSVAGKNIGKGKANQLTRADPDHRFNQA